MMRDLMVCTDVKRVAFQADLKLSGRKIESSLVGDKLFNSFGEDGCAGATTRDQIVEKSILH